MKRKNVIVCVMLLMTIFFVLTLAAADEVRISSIDDSYIGKDVTVSGVIIAISSNIEPSSSKDMGIQTYEPGDTGVLTIDDGTGRIFVSSDPRLLEKFSTGQRVIVTGIYAGKSGIEEGKGIIYADKVSTDIECGCKNVTVKELKEFPEYYYDASVRIKGKVTRIEITPGNTKLDVDDGTGKMEVEYGAEMADIKIEEEVVIEGKFYRTKIYAFAVKAETPVLEETPEPNPSPTSPPSPTPTPTPIPLLTPTPVSSPTSIEAGSIFHIPSSLTVVIVAVVALAGVFISFKVKDWLMLRRYGK